MGMRVDLSQLQRGVAALSAQIKRNELRTLSQIAQHVSGAAKDRAPIDAGQLTADIRGDVIPLGGVNAAVISVASNAASKDYAIAMHEGEYRVGPASLSKQSRSGVPVGRKFIIRAIDDSRDDIITIIKANMAIQ